MNNEQKLNDDLITEITRLQEVTNKQRTIIQNLLEVSQSTLQNYIYSERPILTFGKPILKDNDKLINGMFAPLIELKYENQGKRSATSIQIRPFIISSEKNVLATAKSNNSLEPGGGAKNVFKPKFDIKYKENFYYCLEIEYFDQLLSRAFIKDLYMRYFKGRNNYKFYICDEEECEKLKLAIDEYLLSSGSRELVN